jgi:hypothetical protein
MTGHVIQKVFGSKTPRRINYGELAEIARRGVELGWIWYPQNVPHGTILEKHLQKFLSGHKNTFTAATFAAFLRENDYQSNQKNVLKFLHSQADKNNIVVIGKTSRGTIHELNFQAKAT